MIDLDTRLLGKSGIPVTRIGLGLWGISGVGSGPGLGPTDDEESLATIEVALNAGVTFFDTADTYGDGHSERLLGQAISGRREHCIIATKIGWKDFDRKHRTTAYNTAEKLITGVEGSLRRLQTDYIDVIQSHIDFRDPTMEVFLEGFRKLKEAGKVRTFGVSTGDFDYLQSFNAGGDCATLQIEYNLLNRKPEREIFPYCLEHRIGVIVRGPLAMGILTGKFDANTLFVEGDVRRHWQDDHNQHSMFLDGLVKVERLRPLTQGRTLAQLALQFILAHPAVITVIPGAKTPRQFLENLDALRKPRLTETEWSEIDAITPPGSGRVVRS